MSAGKPEQYRLGFLTTVATADNGYVGGLLVTNQHGRPLEFQCTLPVKPNATQTMLYGPTLEPFILSELIGATLIEKAGVKPHLVLIDQDCVLELRRHISLPVAIVQTGTAKKRLAELPATLSAEEISALHDSEQNSRAHDPQLEPVDSASHSGEADATCSDAAVDSASAGSASAGASSGKRKASSGTHDALEARLGRQRLRFHPAHSEDHAAVLQHVRDVPRDADLVEPFSRVREALQETLRLGGAR